MKHKAQVMEAVVMPDHVRLKIDCHGKMATFVYDESFDRFKGKKAIETVEHMLAAIRNIMDGRLQASRVGVNTCRIQGTVERAVVGDMMAGEFMAWGTAAEMTMREMILMAVMARSAGMEHKRRAAMPPPKPVVIKSRPMPARERKRLEREFKAATQRMCGCAHREITQVDVGMPGHPVMCRKCKTCWAVELPFGGMPGLPPGAKIWVPNSMPPGADHLARGAAGPARPH